MSDFVWKPSEERFEQANIVRLWRKLGCESYHELQRLSVDEPERFYPELVEDLGLDFSTPWERVLDTSNGIEWATWFVAPEHRDELPPPLGGAPARRPGCRLPRRGRGASRADVQRAVGGDRASRGGARRARVVGDRVAILMPMCPEVAVASHACAHVGAVQVPVFSGFGVPAVRQRLEASEAKVVVCADGSFRRGRWLPMRATVDEAAEGLSIAVEWNRRRSEWPGSCSGSRERCPRSRSTRSTAC